MIMAYYWVVQLNWGKICLYRTVLIHVTQHSLEKLFAKCLIRAITKQFGICMPFVHRGCDATRNAGVESPKFISLWSLTFTRHVVKAEFGNLGSLANFGLPLNWYQAYTLTCNQLKGAPPLIAIFKPSLKGNDLQRLTCADLWKISWPKSRSLN